MDHRAQILKTVVSAELGVREVARKLTWAPSRVVTLSKKMKEEGLITWGEEKNTRPSTRTRRGRPKKIMTCTPLGIEFLETYKKLKRKTLSARKADLAHATEDAHYAERLVAAGHSPFQLFLELNTIASNLKIASETAHAP